MMKLWLLKPVNDRAAPWDPWFDKAFGFVVRAETEDAARLLASKDAGDEGSECWLASDLALCGELTDAGAPEVVLREFCRS